MGMPGGVCTYDEIRFLRHGTDRDTLCQNIHGVVDLNVHMITNCRKFFSLVGNRCAVLGLDLVRGASLGIKLPGDDDTVTIEVVFV
jgi:hypothetical protein